jgi:hypothetical protein
MRIVTNGVSWIVCPIINPILKIRIERSVGKWEQAALCISSKKGAWHHYSSPLLKCAVKIGTGTTFCHPWK